MRCAARARGAPQLTRAVLPQVGSGPSSDAVAPGWQSAGAPHEPAAASSSLPQSAPHAAHPRPQRHLSQTASAAGADDSAASASAPAGSISATEASLSGEQQRHMSGLLADHLVSGSSWDAASDRTAHRLDHDMSA
jgi:hypothetical protein